MTNDHKINKQPKDPKLCKMIRKCITINRKELGLEFEDVAHELGLHEGTLANKLKPSMDHSDMTITEFMHFLELTGDYMALEYMAGEFDMVLVPKEQEKSSINDINILVDVANIENADVFRVVKKAMSDNELTEEEKEEILKEIEEAEKANARLKNKVLHIATKE